MKFSYNWLKELTGTKMTVQDLFELLTMKAFEVKEIKKLGNDWMMDIDILPNRTPDCSGHLGLAREICAISGTKFKKIEAKVKEGAREKTADCVKVEVKDKYWCPRYCARAVLDVKVKSSPQYIKERLEVCGLQSINNVVDATNYVMLETGQPLHAFDLSKLSLNKKEKPKIIIRRAKKGEKIVTLDDKKISLNDDILVIANSKEPIAIAGIKGGKKAEIDFNTKNIVLESANFDRLNIYQTSKKIDLKTDASLRFGTGLDANLASFAADRAAALISETTGGKITKGIIDVFYKKPVSKKIKLDLEYVKNLLGRDVLQKEVINILESLGFEVDISDSKYLMVQVPTFRLDILLSEDLIEEIGRVYGYESIPSTFPKSILAPSEKNENIFWENKSKNILKELGFTEVYNYSFISKEQAEIFGLGKRKKGNVIPLENPTSTDYYYLRPSLLPNLLKNVKENLRFFSDFKIFELGNTFFKEKTIKEKKMLSGFIAVKDDKKSETFYEIKGMADSLLHKLGVADVWYDAFKPSPQESNLSFWNSKKCAEIKSGKKEIGFLGEISLRVLDDLNIGAKVVAFDIDFEELKDLVSEEQEYEPVSQHPSAIRDLAVLVPLTARVDDVLKKIQSVNEKLIKDVDLFDIYEGEEVPDNKKNLAFRIIYQAEDRTLSSREIDEIQNKIIKTLEKDPEWQVRK